MNSMPRKRTQHHYTAPDGTIRIQSTGKKYPGVEIIIDAEDAHLVLPYHWTVAFLQKPGQRVCLYAMRREYRNGKRRTVYLHRVLLGLDDPKIHADHIDGDGLNNRRSNLRIADSVGNGRNRRKQAAPASSRYKGVVAKHGKWTARIGDGGKIHLGSFENEEDAARAYDAAARELYGEYACPNFPEEL